jgi:hypothetical protein
MAHRSIHLLETGTTRIAIGLSQQRQWISHILLECSQRVHRSYHGGLASHYSPSWSSRYSYTAILKKPLSSVCLCLRLAGQDGKANNSTSHRSRYAAMGDWVLDSARIDFVLFRSLAAQPFSAIVRQQGGHWDLSTPLRLMESIALLQRPVKPRKNGQNLLSPNVDKS